MRMFGAEPENGHFGEGGAAFRNYGSRRKPSIARFRDAMSQQYECDARANLISSSSSSSVPPLCLSILHPHSPIKLVAFAHFRLFLITPVDPSASA